MSAPAFQGVIRGYQDLMHRLSALVPGGKIEGQLHLQDEQFGWGELTFTNPVFTPSKFMSDIPSEEFKDYEDPTGKWSVMVIDGGVVRAKQNIVRLLKADTANSE
jgi:hypothetical protein